MVIDTSVFVSILSDEPEAPHFEEAIAKDPVRLVSAATVLETGIVMESRRGEQAGVEFDFLLHKAKCEIVDVTSEQIEIARDAYRRFGKGRHTAGLKFGDCFAYSLSMLRGEPLLFKGNDFSQTDVARV